MMSLAGACALLAASVLPAALVVAAIACGGFSSQSLVCAAIGGGICWIAAALALAATFFGNRYHAPVPGVLAGMIFRMGLPLVALVAISKLADPLAASGVTNTILGVYLVALVVETLLAVRMVPTQVVPSGVVPRRVMPPQSPINAA
jgi:hypothetical protein